MKVIDFLIVLIFTILLAVCGQSVIRLDKDIAISA